MKVSWPVVLLPWVIVAVLACVAWAINASPSPMACVNAVKTAAISQRAAQICSTELVGCSLTFEQVKQVIAEQEAAKGCE